MVQIVGEVIFVVLVVRKLIVSCTSRLVPLYYQLLCPPMQVSCMEKITRNEKIVELENYFEGVWASLWRIGRDVELQTNSKKDFIVRASKSKRKGVTQEVIVFLRKDVNGEMKECSRCYATDWGFYYNHLGILGQRIGMYVKTVDRWVAKLIDKTAFD